MKTQQQPFLKVDNATLTFKPKIKQFEFFLPSTMKGVEFKNLKQQFKHKIKSFKKSCLKSTFNT